MEKNRVETFFKLKKVFLFLSLFSTSLLFANKHKKADPTLELSDAQLLELNESTGIDAGKEFPAPAAPLKMMTDQDAARLNLKNTFKQRREMFQDAAANIEKLKSAEGRKNYEAFAKELEVLREKQARAILEGNAAEIKKIDEEM